MRLIWNKDSSAFFTVPPLGLVQKGDIVDVLGKAEIEDLKRHGFENAPKISTEKEADK